VSRPTTSSLATVVVIDDTPDLRMLLRMVLELSDRYTVVGEAGDGASGIDVVRDQQPDLVLLDLAMPIMDGLEALPAIRSACPGAEVVVLSGFEADRMAEQALARGAAGYVQKGTTPDEIVVTLDEVLGRPHVPSHASSPVMSLPAPPSPAVEELRAAFATAAHELRTPATVLVGLAQMLTQRRGALPVEKVDEMLDAIVRQTQVLDRVTADMLATAEAARGGLTANIEPMDLVSALNAAALSIDDRTSVAVTAPPVLRVLADPVRIHQMLINLLSNALKYGEAPISITGSTAGDLAVVRVDDSGLGVAPSFRTKLFDQYSREAGSRAAGTGLGLHVVKALAEAQRGSAWYEPRPGGGSSFFFSIPIG
jgi:signal transduction histidine kinase